MVDVRQRNGILLILVVMAQADQKITEKRINTFTF